MIHRVLSAVREAFQGKPLSLRSSKWHGVRDTWLKDHNSCAACGGVVKLQVHHKQPFHLHPDLELDPTNFITLCETVTKCHLEIGHLGNWKNFNPNVVEDAAKSLATRN